VSPRRPESRRDQDESAFTHILRGLFESSEDVLAVTFVDGEGEAVDYCTLLQPFEAKVIGAHLEVLSDFLARSSVRLGFGHPHEVTVSASEREFLVRRVSDDYSLIVTTKSGGIERPIHAAVERCVDALRREAAIPIPAWEPMPTPLQVFVRESENWKYAPALFAEGEEFTEVAFVLGRWVDDEDERRVCFRVRTREGNEVTLAHDTGFDRWTLVPDE
jgi:hypothetical protein